MSNPNPNPTSNKRQRRNQLPSYVTAANLAPSPNTPANNPYAAAMQMQQAMVYATMQHQQQQQMPSKSFYPNNSYPQQHPQVNDNANLAMVGTSAAMPIEIRDEHPANTAPNNNILNANNGNAANGNHNASNRMNMGMHPSFNQNVNANMNVNANVNVNANMGGNNNGKVAAAAAATFQAQMMAAAAMSMNMMQPQAQPHQMNRVMANNISGNKVHGNRGGNMNANGMNMNNAMNMNPINVNNPNVHGNPNSNNTVVNSASNRMSSRRPMQPSRNNNTSAPAPSGSITQQFVRTGNGLPLHTMASVPRLNPPVTLVSSSSASSVNVVKKEVRKEVKKVSKVPTSSGKDATCRQAKKADTSVPVMKEASSQSSNATSSSSSPAAPAGSTPVKGKEPTASETSSPKSTNTAVSNTTASAAKTKKSSAIRRNNTYENTPTLGYLSDPYIVRVVHDLMTIFQLSGGPYTIGEIMNAGLASVKALGIRKEEKLQQIFEILVCTGVIDVVKQDKGESKDEKVIEGVDKTDNSSIGTKSSEWQYVFRKGIPRDTAIPVSQIAPTLEEIMKETEKANERINVFRSALKPVAKEVKNPEKQLNLKEVISHLIEKYPELKKDSLYLAAMEIVEIEENSKKDHNHSSPQLPQES